MTSEPYTKITGLSHDGRGIAIVDGKTTFLHGALPGETVTYKLTKKHSRYNEGIALTILEPSNERTTPTCEHFHICGGCSMQHMEADAQVQHKEAILLEQLKHFGHVTPQTILPPISGNPWGYRRKARLGVRYVRKKERVLVGFREKFSNYLADIKNCPVLHPAIGTRITELAELIASLAQYEQIPQIEIAVSDSEVALVFRHMQTLPDTDLEKLRRFGQAHQFHIFLQPDSPESVYLLWPENKDIFLHYTLPRYQLNFQFHPLDFTQINSEINPLMIEQALKLLDLKKDDVVLDLFCGLGNFTLPIATLAKQVTGIEGAETMVQRAKQNALHNKITNAEFFAANLMQPSPQSAWMQKKYDKILLDPPRTGAKEIIEYFSQFSAKKIVYVSCNPATFARDAGELVLKHGYQLTAVGVINMFPHTSHVEAMGLFEKI